MECFSADGRAQFDGTLCLLSLLTEGTGALLEPFFLSLEVWGFAGLLILEEESLASTVSSETKDLNGDLVFFAVGYLHIVCAPLLGILPNSAPKASLS